MPADTSSIASPGALERAHGELIARRMPLFAGAWLRLSVLWRSVLVLDAQLAAGPAIVSFVLQVAVLGGAIVLCRADPRAPRVRAVALVADERRRSEALGLVSMEERALALGGRFEIESKPGKGTAVRLECPIAARAPATAV